MSTLTGHTGFVMALLLQSHAGRLVSGARDGLIKIWDYRNGQQSPHCILCCAVLYCVVVVGLYCIVSIYASVCVSQETASGLCRATRARCAVWRSGPPATESSAAEWT